MFRKKCVLHNSLQPLPRLHFCKRPSNLSMQCECTVTPIGWQFFVQPIAAECWRERGGKFWRKHNIYWSLRPIIFSTIISFWQYFKLFSCLSLKPQICTSEVNGYFLIPGSRHQNICTYINFQKTLTRVVMKQWVVANCNEWLRWSFWQVSFFFESLYMYWCWEPGKRKVPLSFCIRGLSKTLYYIYIFEAGDLKDYGTLN